MSPSQGSSLGLGELSPTVLRAVEAFLEAKAKVFESKSGPWLGDSQAIAGAAALRRVAREVRRFRKASTCMVIPYSSSMR